ncbi:MAG: protein kinase [Myxococcota bacterium]
MNTIFLQPAVSYQEVIGSGGMGNVWRGTHRASGTEVAVKVLHLDQAAQIADTFRREVHSIAGLHHPHIIDVFDYSEQSVKAVQSGATEQRLWLAMEYVAEGSLSEHPVARWEVLYTILTQILKALAHAHARGVIHRDLKPGNVLVASWPKRGLPSVKLSDFGIAHRALHTLDPSHDPPKVYAPTAGTPAYMSPEQNQGRWRDYGPWTDLYALGCLGYELCCGYLPFMGDTAADLMLKHLTESPPPLDPCFKVPPGFEAWIHRLMAKFPNQRYQRAVDALYALDRLHRMYGAKLAQEETDELELFPREPTHSISTLGLSAPMLSELDEPGLGFAPTATDHSIKDGVWPLGGGAETVQPGSRAFVPAHEPKVSLGAYGEDRPPMPPLPGAMDPAVTHLSGAGLGLYGLREIPLVGRTAERQALWDALGRVSGQGHCEAVVLKGHSGSGKSRLAMWLVNMAYAHAGVHVLQATHSPIQTFAQGLPGMLATWAGTVGLTRRALFERLERRLETRHQAAALTEVIQPGGVETNDGVPLVRFSSARERFGIVGRFVQELASSGRPVVIWLDDVQWQLETLSFARWLLQHHESNAPVLMVLTLRAGLLEADSPEQAQLDALDERDDVQTLTLEPLGTQARTVLLDALLPLEPQLRDRVAHHTRGQPVFAVHLMEDWVQRGLLVPSPQGWQLAPNTAALPPSLEALWSQRLRHLASAYEHPEEVLHTLEIAASLGEPVDQREWVSTCEAAGYTIESALVEQMVTRRMARQNEQGWFFAHSLLRECVEQRARDGGRWARWHHLCAQVLRTLYPDQPRGLADRLAEHGICSERFEEALDALLLAAAEHYNAGWVVDMERQLDRHQALMEQLAIADDDPRRVWEWIWRGILCRRTARQEDALEWSRRAVALARRLGDDNLLASALYYQSGIVFDQGDLGQAHAVNQEATRLFEQLGSDHGLLRVYHRACDIDMVRGDLESSLTHNDRALEVFTRVEHCGYDIEKGRILSTRATVLARMGCSEEAHTILKASLDLQRQLGNSSQVVNCINDLGEVERMRGNLVEALSWYTQALALYTAFGSRLVSVARINMAITEMAMGHYTKARELFEQVIDDTARTGQTMLLVCAHAEILPCVAAAEDWEAWDHHMTQADVGLRDSQLADTDDAWAVQLGAQLAQQAQQPQRALHAYRLARTLWRRMGNTAKPEAIERAMERLEQELKGRLGRN